MPVTLIEAPFHLGRRGAGMARGPEALFQAGISDALQRRGVAVGRRIVSVGRADVAHEIAGILEVNAAVAREVNAARAEGSLPLVFAGDCATAAGVIGGVGEPLGVVWFDAHGDFNTPETTTSGYFNGMALSLTVGRSWRALFARVDGFTPVEERNVILAGGRAFDPEEGELLRASAMSVVPIEAFQQRGAFERALDLLATRVPRVYLHLDLDVLDPSELHANAMAVAPGASVARMVEAIGEIRARMALAAVMFSSYDPDVDVRADGPGVVERLAAACAG